MKWGEKPLKTIILIAKKQLKYNSLGWCYCYCCCCCYVTMNWCWVVAAVLKTTWSDHTNSDYLYPSAIINAYFACFYGSITLTHKRTCIYNNQTLAITPHTCNPIASMQKYNIRATQTVESTPHWTHISSEIYTRKYYIINERTSANRGLANGWTTIALMVA